MSINLKERARVEAPAADEYENLQDLAQRHLLMHFTPAAVYSDAPPKIFVKAEGCWVTDDQNERFFDALAGLFCVNIGYSYGDRVGEAVHRQMAELPYATTWGNAHPSAVRLAAKIASLAPEGLNRVFFTSGGSESNESAVKLIRQYHEARGDRGRTKFLARRASYHGTSYAALSLNGMTNFRVPFEPLMSGVRHISNTKRYHRPEQETEAQFTAFLLAELEAVILQEGAETVAGLFLEPMQNSGGSLVMPSGYAAGVRALCDQYGLLLVADEVITGFGRLGEWFASGPLGMRPDLITFAKAASSAYAPLGGVIVTDAVVNTVLEGPRGMFLHGVTFGGHPAACAAALENIAIMEELDLLRYVRETEGYFRSRLETLLSHRLVGDVRGTGFHYTIELVTDKASRNWTGDVAARAFAGGPMTAALIESGILCRASVSPDGTPLVQFSPPLVMTRKEIDLLVERVGLALERATTVAFGQN